MSEDLVAQARQDYGALIAKIVTWPPGLGIDVHLIGGGVIQYYPGGGKYVVEQVGGLTKMRRCLAVIRGVVGRIRRQS